MPENHSNSNDPGQKNTGFQTGVAGLKLCDVLELKSGQHFDGLLVIQHEKQTAKIYFNHGELQHATTLEDSGETALRNVLGWKGGKIKVLPQMTYPHRTIDKSLRQLLVETGHRKAVQPEAPVSKVEESLSSSAQGPITPVRIASPPSRTLLAFAALALVLLVVGAWAFFALRPSLSDAGSTASVSADLNPGETRDAITEAGAGLLSMEPQIILRLQGSNTIGSELGPGLARDFLRKLGASEVSVKPLAAEETLVSGYFPDQGRVDAIEIKAHGSSTSFSGLKGQLCDIGMSSRRVKDKERLELTPLGDFMSPSVEHVVAMDGVAVVVNNANQLSTLTLEQIASLFSGAIRDWSEVPASGLSGPVQIYARDEKSGTYDTFNSLVLHPSKQKISPGARRFEDSQELSNLVAADPLGIGFIGLPYINPSKAVAVQEKGSRPIFPTPFTVATEDYPLSRRLYLYLPQTASPVARDFIHFATTDSGQQIAESVGFIKLSVFEQQRAQAKAGEAPEEYRDIARQARRLSMTFHFDSGGTRLDNKAIQDLSRIVDYLNQETNRTRKISLFGFADNLGNPEKNCEISLERARTVEEALAAFGIFAQRSKGLCDRIPIASNETANGRNKNRRVEVWIN